MGNIDIGKYLASSIVVFDLDTKQVKWTAELDLSTDKGNYRAYIYSSPTVADLDGDGYMDILVGTSYGLVYVLDHHGNNLNCFLVSVLFYATWLYYYPMYVWLAPRYNKKKKKNASA